LTVFYGNIASNAMFNHL